MGRRSGIAPKALGYENCSSEPLPTQALHRMAAGRAWYDWAVVDRPQSVTLVFLVSAQTTERNLQLPRSPSGTFRTRTGLDSSYLGWDLVARSPTAA
jgi:hypothetical protein